jgi:RNA polymerase sigma-70 factor (ECF subfamily)
LLTSGKLPSRRQDKSQSGQSALQNIMGQVDELSRDHH